MESTTEEMIQTRDIRSAVSVILQSLDAWIFHNPSIPDPPVSVLIAIEQAAQVTQSSVMSDVLVRSVSCLANETRHHRENPQLREPDGSPHQLWWDAVDALAGCYTEATATVRKNCVNQASSTNRVRLLAIEIYEESRGLKSPEQVAADVRATGMIASTRAISAILRHHRKRLETTSTVEISENIPASTK